MRSMPRALLWEMLSHGRWTLPGMFLLAIMLPLLIYGALSGFSVDPRMLEFVVLQFAFLPIVIFQLALGIAMAHGQLSRLYALPISTNSIVAWHMFSGALFVAAETAAAAWLLNTLFRVEWPILGLALFAAAAWSALQVVLSVSSMQSLPAFIVAGTPAILLCLWLGTRYGGWFSPPQYYWSVLTPTEVVTLLGAFGICFAMTTYSVGLARSGERLPTFGTVTWLTNQWNAFSLSRTPARFRSAADAQFWFDWQLKGIALPLVTLIMMLIAVANAIISSWYMQVVNLAPLYENVLLLGGFLSALALPAGLFIGIEIDVKGAGQRETQFGDSIGQSEFESSMGSFLSSRPLSSNDFGRSILRTAALSALIAWLIWFVVFSACLLTMWLSKQYSASIMPRGIGMLYLPLTILGPWCALANISTIGLSGRGPKILVALVSLFVGYAVLNGIIEHFTSDWVAQRLHSVCVTFTASLIVVASVWAFVQARRRRLITSRALLTVSLAAGAMGFTAILLRPTAAHFTFYPITFAFLALVALPFASVPLAISWNRHR